MLRRRTPLRPGKPLQTDRDKARAWERRSRQRLPNESERRKAERPTRAQVLDLAMARDRGCVGRSLIPGHVCRGPVDGHEKIPRSAWPGGHLVLDNCVMACRSLHSWIHDHPQEAYALGLLRKSWERPVDA